MPDPVKPSRLLVRLDAEIAAAPTQLLADCKRAERAGYLARLGKFEECNNEINIIRQDYFGRETSIITIWLNLIEGISALSKSFDLCARDKIVRSHALSLACNNRLMRSLSAAWMAHVEYLKNDFDSMAAFAAESLNYSSGDEHASRARVFLVLALANQFAGRLEVSNMLYKDAHMHASADGDDAMISALMHNKTWLQAQELRFCEWQIGGPADERAHTLMAADSIKNFDELLGLKNLETSVPMLKAMVLSAQGKYAHALDLYDKYLLEVFDGELSRWDLELLVDQVWCAININRSDSRVEKIFGINLLSDEINKRAPDQRFLIFSRVYQIQKFFDGGCNYADAYELATKALLDHKSFQDRLCHILSKYNFIHAN
jgi:tetratricopeptide (TPR) repeat protein